MSVSDSYFRKKVTFLQFCLSIAIIYQHTKLQGLHPPMILELRNLLFFLVETAVPTFFMISGYLFFRTYTPDIAKVKMFKRVHSLLVPYLIWNIVYAVFTVTLGEIGLISEYERISWGGYC